VTGGGVHARVEGKAVLVGKRSLLVDQGVSNVAAALDERADGLQQQGRTVVYVAVAGQFAGHHC
jgi:Cu+-exporting ATPase